MILNTINNVKLFRLLFFIDTDLAEQKRGISCPFCGAPLHFTNYLRKPRGGPDNLPEAFSIRHSLCCSAENCRKRVLPSSIRFWDRKVYWSIVILMTVERCDINSIVNAAASDFDPGFQGRGVKLVASEDRIVNQMYFDPFKVGQVARNLLANAIEYGGTSKQVEIRFAETTFKSNDI